MLIRSSHSSGGFELSDLQPSDPSRPLDSFTATMVLDGLRASTPVYACGFEGLIDLFDDLARSWRGWEGEKAWESLEGEFKLVCSCDRLGHVQLRIELRASPGPTSWLVDCTLMTEAGQLGSVAEAMREFFAGRRLDCGEQCSA